LNALIERKVPIIGISFGNPYLLSGFTGLRTYMVAYGDMPSLQQAAARAVFGHAHITGKLPISLPGLYARGTGIEVKATANAAAKDAKGMTEPTQRTTAPRDGVGEARPPQ
jgi:hypothetical protein